jgi:hypothetical protein
MKGIHAIILAGGLALLVCGCAASPNRAGSPDEQLAERRPLLEAQGFAVLDFRARRDEYGRVCVVGEVENTGFMARAVELQATLRDGDGRIVAVGHFYPASQTNIKPSETWPFAYSFGRQDDIGRAELRIVGAFRTMELSSVASDAR